jgi:hypothetical protein
MGIYFPAAIKVPSISLISANQTQHTHHLPIEKGCNHNDYSPQILCGAEGGI